MCLSDTSYVEEANRIPPEPTQPIPTGSNPVEEHQSDVEDSSESSSCESEEENPTAKQSKDSDDNGNQSGDEGGMFVILLMSKTRMIFFLWRMYLILVTVMPTKRSKAPHKE